LLASASMQMEVTSGIGSESSEPRDQLDEGRRVQEELERRSSSSASSRRARRIEIEHSMDVETRSEADSCCSMGTTNSVRAVYKADATANTPRGAGGSTTSGSSKATKPSTSLETPVLLDKVELAITESKRAALERVRDTASGSGSVSHVGSGSSSMTSQRSPAMPLPASLVQALPADKKLVIDKVVSTVIDKTGQELAQMQVALDKAKEKAMAEAREKAELEAKLAKGKTELFEVKSSVVNAVALDEALKEQREKKIEAEEERDDLKDKLVGIQTLMDAKLERHMQEKEELKQKAHQLEEELRSQAEGQDENLKEELATAAKEMEKAKKQKYAVQAERDVIRRAELIAKKAHEAEIQALKAEMAAARVELKKAGVRAEKVLPIVAGEEDPDLDPENNSAESLLALKLRDQRETNKKLHQDFEKLRLEMLQMHQEKENELAGLKAKAEVQATLLGKLGKGRQRKPAPKQGGKLSSIDEEDDEEMASQAGSGVSGQISSDCDGVGVGDLRDFEDFEDNSAKVQCLQAQLADKEAWYKHLNELKKAKEAEYQAKIQRMTEQLQVVREEAMENIDLARKLEVDKQEIAAEKEAEVAIAQARLLSQQLENMIPGAGDSAKQEELEEKLRRYTTQVLKLEEQLENKDAELNAALEAKRTLTMRLSDTRRELEAMEERHKRALAQLHARLRSYGDDGFPREPEPCDTDIVSKVWSLEEERNLLKNELEGQQVLWQAKLESEQRQSEAVLAKLKEQQDVAEKDRELTSKVEERLLETERALKLAKQSLADTQQKLAMAESAKQAAPTSLLDLLRCPTRSRSSALPMQMAHSPEASCQGIVWQVIASIGGVAALLCADESLIIRDASKKAFTMWGSGKLRGSSLFSLIFDEAMASWLKSELEAPATPAFANPGHTAGFWLRDLGWVEFRSRLGSAFEASVSCVRLPEEAAQGKPPVVVVIVQPNTEEEQRQNHPQNQMNLQHNKHHPSLWQGSRSGYRHGPASVASSVHSEDITANDSVSNVNVRF